MSQNCIWILVCIVMIHSYYDVAEMIIIGHHNSMHTLDTITMSFGFKLKDQTFVLLDSDLHFYLDRDTRL